MTVVRATSRPSARWRRRRSGPTYKTQYAALWDDIANFKA